MLILFYREIHNEMWKRIFRFCSRVCGCLVEERPKALDAEEQKLVVEYLEDLEHMETKLMGKDEGLMNKLGLNLVGKISEATRNANANKF